MKKIILFLIILFSLFQIEGVSQTNASLFFINQGGNAPKLNCAGLPSCPDGDISNPGAANIEQNVGADFIRSIIKEMIQVVAVAAVFALVLSGLYYLISAGNEEKTNRAKKWIIGSLAGVIFAVLSWSLITWINTLNI